MASQTLKVIGIEFVHTPQDGFFKKVTSFSEEVKNNFINLLMTNHGERMMRPNFGCNFKELLFEPDFDIDEKIRIKVIDQTDSWMPYLDIHDVNIETLGNKKTVTISYTVPKLIDLQIVELELILGT